MQAKKFLIAFLVLAVVALLAFSSSQSLANAKSERAFELPAQAREVAPNVFFLGEAVENGERVQGYAIFHPREEFTHKPGPDQGDGNGASGSGSTTSSCFAVFAKGARWKVTEQYVLDATNNDGMTSQFVANTISTGLETWDAQVAFDVFGTRDTTKSVDGADTASPDGKNEVFFGSISSPGAVAVTIVWGIFSGPIGGRRLVEWDQVYDHIDFNFGDAGPTSETTNANVSFMDLLNIAVHEDGHSGGLAHPADSCTEESMYRFVSFGETKKRTLHDGDIAGIHNLYGA